MSEALSSPRPLSDRVTGPRSLVERVRANQRVEANLIAILFGRMDTRSRLQDALGVGAFSTVMLSVAHGLYALGGVFAADISQIATHGLLTAAGILAYYALLGGRSVWPSVLVLGWLLIEISLGQPVFGYRAGGSILNWIAILPALISIRAALRNRVVLATPVAAPAHTV